MEFTDPHSL
ncbi:hypothetical protein LEMLEM_LOCUS23824 [Lemmus lemmus]